MVAAPQRQRGRAMPRLLVARYPARTVRSGCTLTSEASRLSGAELAEDPRSLDCQLVSGDDVMDCRSTSAATSTASCNVAELGQRNCPSDCGCHPLQELAGAAPEVGLRAVSPRSASRGLALPEKDAGEVQSRDARIAACPRIALLLERELPKTSPRSPARSPSSLASQSARLCLRNVSLWLETEVAVQSCLRRRPPRRPVRRTP